MLKCECQQWARTRIILITQHHPDCPHYDPEGDARVIIEALIKGIDVWAADEDGVHYKAWDAYIAAHNFLGLPLPLFGKQV